MTDVLTSTVVSISADAAERLQGLMREKNLGEQFALRVFVAGGGCSGLQYGMTFDDQVRDGDTEFLENGLRVLVDPMSAKYMTGATIDYVDSLMGGGFKIENPNAVSSCGCGSSFRPKEDGSEAQAQSGGCGSGGCGCH
jgi:iron-sulfur cluster assembly accessory protein